MFRRCAVATFLLPFWESAHCTVRCVRYRERPINFDANQSFTCNSTKKNVLYNYVFFFFFKKLIRRRLLLSLTDGINGMEWNGIEMKLVAAAAEMVWVRIKGGCVILMFTFPHRNRQRERENNRRTSESLLTSPLHPSSVGVLISGVWSIPFYLCSLPFAALVGRIIISSEGGGGGGGGVVSTTTPTLPKWDEYSTIH